MPSTGLLRHSEPITALKHTRAQKDSIAAAMKTIEEQAAELMEEQKQKERVQQRQRNNQHHPNHQHCQDQSAQKIEEEERAEERAEEDEEEQGRGRRITSERCRQHGETGRRHLGRSRGSACQAFDKAW